MLETNFGRTAGWEVFRGTMKVADLVDVRPVDMFIDRYKIVASADAAGLNHDMESEDFWLQEPLRCVSCEFGDEVPGAIPLRVQRGAEPLLDVRGLHIVAPAPSWLERVKLSRRSRHRRQRNKRAALNRTT